MSDKSPPDVGMADATKACKPTKMPLSSPRFEIKKWNAVAMWSWDICADTVRITVFCNMPLLFFFILS